MESNFVELHTPSSVFNTSLHKISTTPIKIMNGSNLKATTLSYVSMCNVTADTSTFSLYVNNGTDNYYVYKDYPIAAGTTFIVEKEQAEYIKLKPTWEVYLVSDTADSLDAVVSQVDNEGRRIT